MRAESPLHHHLDALLAALKGSLRLPRQQRRAQARRLARDQGPAGAAATGTEGRSGLSLHLLAAALAAIGAPAGLMANPQGAQVVHGSASFQADGKTLTVTNSNGAIINWQQFNIGAGETTRFVQPSVSSQVLNRVLGGSPSQILGSLQSNGQVFLINPSGIVFGKGAQVDVGALAFSTLRMSDEDFKAGRMRFGEIGAGTNGLSGLNGSTVPGAIRNEGTIRTASGGFVYLVAPQVENSGLIHSPEGQVLLAAGHKVSIVNPRTPEVSWEVSAPASNAVNLGEIVAKQIVLQGQNVRNSGLLQATTAVLNEKGQVVLTGTQSVALETSARVKAQGSDDEGREVGGSVALSAPDVRLGTSTTIDASGKHRGGTVHVGGGLQGAPIPGLENTPRARTLTMDSGAVIKADATAHGQGGDVILWSDDTARIHGSLSARGGAQGGDGGFIETSGATIKLEGVQVDTRAAQGQTGNWLIDPTNIWIAIDQASATAAGMVGTDASANTGSTPFKASGSPADSLLTVATLQTALSTTDVMVLTAGGGAGDGDINVVSNLSWSANKLTLKADRDININAVVTASGTSQLDLGRGSGGSVKVGFNSDGTFKGRVDFPGRSGTGFLTIDNEPYTVINALGAAGSTTGLDLQGMRGTANLAKNYALGANIDASATSSWNSGAGFLPVGNSSSNFTGKFNGLGHTITGLSINRPTTSYVGLFGYAGSRADIRNVGLMGGSVSGYSATGGLAGWVDSGTVSHSFATGVVTGSRQMIGGLVGTLKSGTLSHSYATGAVTAGTSYAGGLVGSLENGTVSNSYAIGSVTGPEGFVGGLVGDIYGGSVHNSYATGNVTGATYAIGGLVGSTVYGIVRNSYATGNVTSDSGDTGGLVGYLVGGEVDDSYATGAVTGRSNLVIGTNSTGGLVGQLRESTVRNSYASGSVNGYDYTGGLVGYLSRSNVSTSYASGSVTSSEGAESTGGLVGYLYNGTLSNSFASGSVIGYSMTGGLAGLLAVNSTVSNSYAHGSVTGFYDTGGLVGQVTTSTVGNSYAAGNVIGSYSTGGLVGLLSNSTVNVEDTSEQASGCLT